MGTKEKSMLYRATELIESLTNTLNDMNVNFQDCVVEVLRTADDLRGTIYYDKKLVEKVKG